MRVSARLGCHNILINDHHQDPSSRPSVSHPQAPPLCPETRGIRQVLERCSNIGTRTLSGKHQSAYIKRLEQSSQKLLLKRTTRRCILSTTSLTLFDVLLAVTSQYDRPDCQPNSCLTVTWLMECVQQAARRSRFPPYPQPP